MVYSNLYFLKMILVAVWGKNLREGRAAAEKLTRRSLLPPRPEMVEAWSGELAAAVGKSG